MIDLREKIKSVIEEERSKNHFSVLDDNSIELIQQIFNNYEITNSLKYNFSNIPKRADLIFLAAPTGAGKDSLVVKLKLKNPDKNYIELNMDMFRHYFPQFMCNISELNDKTFARQTNEFAYEMYFTTQEILLSEFPGTNIIITGTLWKIDWVEETFKKYKSNKFTNYTIKMVSLAVPYKESAISIIRRYVQIVDLQKNEIGFVPGTARYTSLEYHDDTFRIFPENLKYFENLYKDNPGSLIDNMEVYKRSIKIDDYEEDTLEYSSTRLKNINETASETIIRLRNKKVDFERDYILEIFYLINKNKDYLKEQGTLIDVVADLAKLLDYERIFKDKISNNIDEEYEEEK